MKDYSELLNLKIIQALETINNENDVDMNNFGFINENRTDSCVIIEEKKEVIFTFLCEMLRFKMGDAEDFVEEMYDTTPMFMKIIKKDLVFLDVVLNVDFEDNIEWLRTLPLGKSRKCGIVFSNGCFGKLNIFGDQKMFSFLDFNKSTWLQNEDSVSAMDDAISLGILSPNYQHQIINSIDFGSLVIGSGKTALEIEEFFKN